MAARTQTVLADIVWTRWNRLESGIADWPRSSSSDSDSFMTAAKQAKRKARKQAKRKAREQNQKAGRPAPHVVICVDGVEREFYRVVGCDFDTSLLKAYQQTNPNVKFTDISKVFGSPKWAQSESDEREKKNVIHYAIHDRTNPFSTLAFAQHNAKKHRVGEMNIWQDIVFACPATDIYRLQSQCAIKNHPELVKEICDGNLTPIMCCAKCLGSEPNQFGWVRDGFDWICPKCR